MVGVGFNDPEQLYVLHKMCREGNTTDVARLPPSRRHILNTRSPSSGRTALHEACANGHRDVVAQLLQFGADPHRGTYLGGDTALHLAVSSGQRPLVVLLLRYGCDPNLPNNFGGTCFHYAGAIPAVVKLLLRYGAKANIRDRSGKTPWDCVHEGCPQNRDLNRMMKQAYEFEEKKLLNVRKRWSHTAKKDGLAEIREEEHALTAKKREKMAIEESERTGHRSKAAMEYMSWREKTR